MSGVVHLPPQPKKQSISSILARLRSYVFARPPRERRFTAGAAGPHDREPGRVYPITANGGRTVRSRPAPGTLQIRSRRIREQHLVELSGELDLRTRDPLAGALEAAVEDDSQQIVLDLSDLVDVDRAGLDTILTAHMRAGDELKPLVIVPGPRAVQRVFDDAQAPFCYVTTEGGPAAGASRSRSRRSGLSARPGRRTSVRHRQVRQ